MEQNKPLEAAIRENSVKDGAAAIAYAVLRLADAQRETAAALRALGLADAATPMGAIEALSLEVKGVAASLDLIASAVEGGR